MVNEEPIGVFQEVGNKEWYKELPKNVTLYSNYGRIRKIKIKSKFDNFR